MKMRDLIRYGFPEALILQWEKEESADLLPLQEIAIKQYRLLEDGSLLIQAPTSSGKTFVGELAAVNTVLQRKKAVYLVPLKALAEEKYLELCRKYAAYGFRIEVSSSDHRGRDEAVERGEFSLAVMVYEKAVRLLMRRPERFQEIALVIADELELLADPERGPAVEFLLTALKGMGCRVVGLSAVLGNAEALAEWLGAACLRWDRRPVELRYGVLHDGVFRYRSHHETGTNEEILTEGGTPTAWEAVACAVERLVARGETCLVFVKAKHEAWRAAELLALRLGERASADALARVESLEPSRARDVLQALFRNGVGFHSADLTPAERRVVEESFRRGDISVLVSTSTLAQGLNLPAQNVFISADKWRYDRRLTVSWKTPILQREFENMAGRAGRYGTGSAFGRAILVAASPLDAEALWRRYIEGQREPIEPQLAHESLPLWVLRWAAMMSPFTLSAAVHFFGETLTGCWQWRPNYTEYEIAFRLREAIRTCLELGFVETVPALQGNPAVSTTDTWNITPLGRAVAAAGITFETAALLLHALRATEGRTEPLLDLLYTVAAAPEPRMPHIPLSQAEYEHSRYVEEMRERLRNAPCNYDTPLNRWRNSPTRPLFEEVRALKMALALEDWANGVPLPEIEQRFQTTAGQIQAAAEHAAWLVDTLSVLAQISGYADAVVADLQTLTVRLVHGVDESLVAFARASLEGVTRSDWLALRAQGVTEARALATVPRERLERWVRPEAVEVLLRWAKAQQAASAVEIPAIPPTEGTAARMPSEEEEEMTSTAHNTTEAVAPALIVDDRRPGQIHVDGKTIRLQEKQYRLIRLLAQHPGVCVPYEVIYETLWQDVIVEPNQVCYQKTKLIQAIVAVCPSREGLITTVPKRGFRLNLTPDDVRVDLNPLSMAARTA